MAARSRRRVGGRQIRPRSIASGVRCGGAPFWPAFPMFFVEVFPTVTPADTPAKAKGRRRTKFNLVLDLLADIVKREGLPCDLEPAEIEREDALKVPPEFRRRWEKLGPDGRPKPPVSRTVIYRAYQDYLKARSSK